MKQYYSYEVYENGDIFRNGKKLKPQLNNKGYHYVFLSINGIRKKEYIHRMVGKLFIQNENNKSQINHINGIKTDNRVNNLEWVDNRENQLHAINNGLKKLVPKGDKNVKSKKVRMIDKEGNFKDFGSLRSALEYIGKDYSSYSSIAHCCKGDIGTAFGYKWEYV